MPYYSIIVYLIILCGQICDVLDLPALDMTTVALVFCAALVTALATGLGALPLLLHKRTTSWVGVGYAVATGLMLAASFSLLWQGGGISISKTGLGIILGFALIILASKALHRYEDLSFANLQGADAKRAMLVIGVMTVHSAAEGVGLGVAFGDTYTFGWFVTILLSLHNIPEGLAIALMMVPKGTSVKKASLWAIFSSLPQPLIAVPAFIFVLAFDPFLPIGLGLAAGAMIWMAIFEMLPRSYQEIGKAKTSIWAFATLAACSPALVWIS